MYTCSNCHKGVIVLNGKAIKGCNCEASILANMSSNLVGKSSLS